MHHHPVRWRGWVIPSKSCRISFLSSLNFCAMTNFPFPFWIQNRVQGGGCWANPSQYREVDLDVQGSLSRADSFYYVHDALWWPSNSHDAPFILVEGAESASWHLYPIISSKYFFKALNHISQYSCPGFISSHFAYLSRSSLFFPLCSVYGVFGVLSASDISTQ